MSQENRQLEGWKEIASHLGRTVRTVQAWEKELGLPIVRLRNRVSAGSDDLDRWLAAQLVTPPAAPEEPLAAPVPVARSAWRWILAAAFGVAAAFATVSGWRQAHLNPVAVRVDGLQLVTIDAENREVWRYTLPSAPTRQENPSYDPREYQRTLFTDLDGDGRNELLYVFWPVDSAGVGTTVYCLRPTGEVAWTYRGGRPLTLSSGQTLSGTYNASLLGTLRRPRPDGGRIVVGSHHPHSWPYQVALLDIDGRRVADYIHPGWLMKLAIADLDGDGIEELALGGVNNTQAYGPTLVVLDSRRIGGQGPGRPEKLIPGLATGLESAVLIFPSPDTPQAAGVYYRTHRLAWSGDHLEAGIYQSEERPDVSNVTYRLDRQLRVTGIYPNTVWEETRPPGAAARELAGVRSLRNRWLASPSALTETTHSPALAFWPPPPNPRSWRPADRTSSPPPPNLP